MEGYTDVTGNLDSFDDLDIEGKSTSDDWNTKETFQQKSPKQNYVAKGFDEKEILTEKVLLNDGSQGFCFSAKEHDRNTRWTCHVCNTAILGTKNFHTHILGKKHEANMLLPHHNRANFTKILNKKEVEKLHLAPGEPVPPGFEDEVEAVLQIQSTLDNYKMHPLIGLEYLVELTDPTKEPQYNCMLCNKKGDPRTVMGHLTSHNHRLSYIEKHFTLTFNAINNLPKSQTLGAKKGVADIVTRISSKIEEKYGRLPPVGADADSFESQRSTITAQIDKGPHFNEAPEDTFVDLVDKNLLTIGLKADEVPPAEAKTTPAAEDDEVEFQGAFIKGTRVAVDRSALRVRKIEDMMEPVEEKKTLGTGKKVADAKKRRVMPAKSVSPFSTISSSSSDSVRSQKRNRSRSTSRRRIRSRSRSRSRNRSHRPRYSRRSRSISRSRRRRSRSRSRSRSLSRSRRRSRSASRSRRARSPYVSYRNSRNTNRNYHDHKKDDKKDRSDDLSTEKAKWERFREDVDKVEKELREQLKFHEKNPEKHPQYPEEWKLFWNRRYKELQAIGVDPSKHDFKPEWIDFWNKRMRELHEAEFTAKKEEIRERLGLPPDNPEPIKPAFRRKRPAPMINPADQLEPISPDEDKRDPVAEMKSTWKAFTGSDIRDSRLLRSRSPSPWEENVGRGRLSPEMRRGPKDSRLSKEPDYGLSSRYRRDPPRHHNDGVRTISVLRTLTALENQLGSLGPKVNTLLSEAIALDKLHSGNSDAILANDENLVLFETVREKLKGQLYANIIERNMVAPTKSAVQSITELLARTPSLLGNIKPMPAKKPASVAAPVLAAPVIAAPIVEEPAIVSEPVTVPGIGAVDKVAIAQQIAAALVAQGKTDVTHEELEQLINAVVGMAQASVDAQEPISTADFVSSLTKTAEAAAPASKSPPGERPESAITDDSSRSVPTPSEELRPASSDKVAPSITKVDEALHLRDAAETRPSAPSNVTVSVSSSFTVTSAASFTSMASMASTSLASSVPPPVLSSAGQTTTVTTAATETKMADRPMNASPPPPAAQKASAPSFASRLVKPGYGHDDLTEDDLKTLLQNFKDLSTEEQHGLILYLKKLEATDMDRVEKLRKFVNLGPSTAPAAPPVTQPVVAAAPAKKVETVPTTAAAKERNDCGPLSPFSLRHGGANPTRDLEARRAANELQGVKLMDLDDSDDDYTFEDVYAAASKKVKERMAEEERIAKEKMAEETRLKEERERERERQRLENEEQDKKEKEERERKEKEDREKWEAEKGAAAALALAAAAATVAAPMSSTHIPAISRSPTDPSILLKQTTDVLDDLMGSLSTRFNKQAASTAPTPGAPAATTYANAQPVPQTLAPTQAPTEAPTQATAQAPSQAPTQATAQAPSQAPSQAPVDSRTGSSYSNYYGNTPYNQPPPASSNGYDYYRNDQYRQLSYPGGQRQGESALNQAVRPPVMQNAIPNQMPMPGQNPYPQMHGGYYPNQPTGMYQAADYQNVPNYQNPAGNYQNANYNNPQMYGQGYVQQMYPQQAGQYGQYNQRSYY